jgi:tektin-3
LFLHDRLVLEVKELQRAIDVLHQQLEAAEKSQQSLLRTKSQLESDLKVKNNSIVIDREKCLGVRRSFPVTSLVPEFP